MLCIVVILYFSDGDVSDDELIKLMLAHCYSAVIVTSILMISYVKHFRLQLMME